MMDLFSKKLPALLLLAAFLISLALYHSSLNYFLFQDDFFEINISKAHNLHEYLEFFKFRNDIIAYRPISLQNYFFFSNYFFGLNPMGFRLISFVFFMFSGFLIIKLATAITKNFKIGLLTSFFWLTSSIHFMALSWIAAAYNIIGTFFWLLTSFIFLKYLKKQKAKFYLLSFIFYLLTVGSFEFSITWPAILGFYYFYVLKNTIVKSIKIFSPFILISAFYLIARFLFIKVPQITEYAIKFDLDSTKALFWYILWALNIPEEFKKQVVTNLLVFNPQFLSEFWPLIFKTFLGAFLVLVSAVIIPIKIIIKNGPPINFRLIGFAIIWFAIAVLPVLIIPNHTFSMYLTLPALGIYILISYLVVQSKRTILVVPVLLIWLATSISTLNFYKINSWMVEAQRTAQEFSFDTKQQFPRLESNSVVLYPLSAKWQRQALLDQHAIRAIYNDPSLSIYYNKESLLKAYKNGSITGPVYIYIPK